MRNTGLIYLFTGDGKGKTSAALGTIIRALANGWRVTWLSFYKEASWPIGENQLPTMLCPPWSNHLEIKLLGKGFYIQKNVKTAAVGAGLVVDDDSPETHRQAAQVVLDTAAKTLKRTKNRPNVLVLDEIGNALSDGLCTEKQVIALLSRRGTTHIILTGRNMPTSLIELADLVSRIDKVKHPFDAGQLAIKGLDY